MNKPEVMRMQTCVLRVNIHCDGCEKKVKKLLKRTEGVYTAKIDAEQGKVTVAGNIDPAVLIQKLEKSGKHAELWSAPKVNSDQNNNQTNLFFNNQFKNMTQQMDNQGKDGKSQKSGSVGNGKDGQNPQQQTAAADFQAQLQQHMMNIKGNNVNGKGKDPKFPAGNQKSVKFKLPEDESDLGSEEFDNGDFDDEEFSDDDESDDGIEGHSNGRQKGGPKQQHHQQQGDGGGKVMRANKKKSEVVDEKGCGKKGGGFDIQGLLKALGGGGGNIGKNGGKDGKNQSGKNGKNSRGKANKGGNGRDKSGGKNDVGKKGGIKKSKDGGGAGGGRKGKGGDDIGGGKKGGKKTNNGAMNKMIQPGFSDLNGFNQMTSTRGAGGGNGVNTSVGSGGGGFIGPMGSYPHHPMGQMGGYQHPMGNYPTVQGLPTGTNINAGYYPARANPYMTTLNSQQQQPYGGGLNNGEMFHHPAMYRAHPPPMAYVPQMPPPHSDPFVHMFSDENTGSCSVM